MLTLLNKTKLHFLGSNLLFLNHFIFELKELSEYISVGIKTNPIFIFYSITFYIDETLHDGYAICGVLRLIVF